MSRRSHPALPHLLQSASDLGAPRFFVGHCNKAAVRLVEAWPDWPGHCLVLAGPPGSGKSHLAAIWAAAAQAQTPSPEALAPDRLNGSEAVLLDQAERCLGTAQGEETLFHLYNILKEGGGWLLLTVPAPPGRLDIALPDLASRLRGAMLAEIDAPDDATLEAVLRKQFEDRQVRVPDSVIAYLLPRMERSFAAARRLVERLDRRALSAQQAITTKLAREELEAMAAQQAPLA